MGKAKHAGWKNPLNKNLRKKHKPSFKKRFLGTDIRTVTQLSQLKCSTGRKLAIAKKLRQFAESVLAEEVKNQELFLTKERVLTAESALRDWDREVERYSAVLHKERIDRFKKKQKVHTPFKGLWAHPAAQK